MAEAVLLKQILGELTRNAEQIRQEELEGFADQIQKARRVFVAGAGRSGFVARAFSNRLMHLGLTVYFVGEPTMPGSTPKSELADTAVSVQPMGNAFEQMLWLICDTVVIILMKRLGRTEEEMFALHANLE